MNLNYEQVMVMGSGSLASNCILHLLQMHITIPMTIYETNITNISTLESLAASNGIKYIDVPKEEIFLDLAAIRKSTLIFVIGCYYIIPAEVIGNRCLSIINYHNSLLPKHPGRNAEAWAIYEQDSTTGITWHYVDERIDAGEIIIQREIQLDDSFSSLSLLRLQNQIAFDTFKLIINDLLIGGISSYKQNEELRGKLHLSKDIPNGGFLEISWDIHKIKAFLRAMDYGALRRMGQPKVIINNVKHTWDKTVFLNQGKNRDELIVNEDENYLLISKDGESIKLIGLNQEME
ncbi:hypothetical protein M5W83_15045 [Paenibacillus thiaminolyticus]|uniref:phosphoribosylglycinamide formyltransferase 1 n=1 Tax=Paenibacillus thiaminolyticus TaxID=49283 RepID=A0AAP9J1H3_PANTH|nr:formyltransferase family protein [Paenibacillus thiaminolyticus]MCY9534068.1 hypothetical protein [Paenibacillus thiaminolyticus]MCY9600098.1 hypothetical protein [Paenibacillus thiaminolyticus]MCY9608464.1 hypothetical protein [Paenibacillus thiaminolyticus]MCY9615245.1 hypothetical protein [Paenibacillus thiaminolyticus]MCY9620548.1 hypothetical protein [Paenibacillus thiaminolyticus]